jgi:subtilisin family serine protease
VDDDYDPFSDDGQTHGTHVAGTILAAKNGVGVFGVAYNANLYDARVLGPNGSGPSSDVMQGVQWLVEAERGPHCKVVNLSLGGSRPSRTEERFYNVMRSEGALIVCAAGNDGTNHLLYPAAYASNIAVGAVDSQEKLASFSNYGPQLDLVAPGVNVLSSVPTGQGSEASVTTTTSTTFTAIGMEFAGKTDGTSGTLIDCKFGLTADDFPSGVKDNIALIQRGTNTFADKVTNAMNAGAKAVIIFNNTAGDFNGTLGTATTSDGRSWIPAVSVSDTTGAALLEKNLGTLTTVVNKISDWDYKSGTSMATPHVTGEIALIWSANHALTNSTVEDYVFSTCKDLGDPGFDKTYGHGLIDAYKAVLKAQNET